MGLEFDPTQVEEVPQMPFFPEEVLVRPARINVSRIPDNEGFLIQIMIPGRVYNIPIPNEVAQELSDKLRPSGLVTAHSLKDIAP